MDLRIALDPGGTLLRTACSITQDGFVRVRHWHRTPDSSWAVGQTSREGAWKRIARDNLKATELKAFSLPFRQAPPIEACASTLWILLSEDAGLDAGPDGHPSCPNSTVTVTWCGRPGDSDQIATTPPCSRRYSNMAQDMATVLCPNHIPT